MTKLINIAVVGAGLIGIAHIQRITESPESQLCAIVDPASNAQAVARKYDVPVYDSLEKLFESQTPDGIILATPNQFHVTQTLKCLEQKIPVLVEKPVAQSIEEGKLLLEKVKQTGAKVLVGHHRAYSSIIENALEILQEGVIGKPVTVMGSALFLKPDSYFIDGVWRTKKGGGPILLNLIHEIGNLRSLLGEIVSVQAITSNAIRNYEVEDTCAITLRFLSGTIGTFILSDTASSAKSWEQTSKENKSYPNYEDEDCYHIAGTEGSLSIPTMRIKHYPNHNNRSWWTPFECTTKASKNTDPLESQLRHFCALIRNEEEPRVSVKDGLQNLMVIDAIVKASESGTKENVEILI
jgi:predicted dehydrogenase